MKAAGVEDAVATKFFDELIKRHTEVLEPIAKAEAAAAAAAAEAAAKEAAAKEAAAKEHAAAAAAAAAAGKPPPPPPPKPAAPKPPEPPPPAELDFTASISVKNPFGGGGDVQVDEMDFTGGTTAPPPPAAKGGKRGPSDAELTDKIVAGTWMEFKEKKDPDSEEVTVRPAKLSYVSPMKSRYLFIDRSGKTVLECSRAELARRMRLGDVVVMDEAPLFDRIMGGLVSKMRAAPPPPAAPH